MNQLARVFVRIADPRSPDDEHWLRSDHGAAYHSHQSTCVRRVLEYHTIVLMGRVQIVFRRCLRSRDIIIIITRRWRLDQCRSIFQTIHYDVDDGSIYWSCSCIKYRNSSRTTLNIIAQGIVVEKRVIAYRPNTHNDSSIEYIYLTTLPIPWP